MKLVVITPVGPGHDWVVNKAIESVKNARLNRIGFTEVKHMVIDDHDGRMGRSKARNSGMIAADWYFFLDADDLMRPDAMSRCDFGSPATFGSVSLTSSRRLKAKNIYPCGWRDVALYGSAGTLSMGFFCRADIARALKFNETMDAGEDFDFYMRLPSFTKINRPLVDIGYDIPSARGPRGYVDIDWVGTCNRIITVAVEKEPKKYALGGYAVLAKAEGSKPKSGTVPQAIC